MQQPVKILLVDDEDDLLSTMEFRLGGLGYDVSIARNGAEALSLMNRQKADVVLADFMMPEVNGIELTRIIKSHPLWFDTQVVLFSCNAEPEFRRKALDLGATEYLPKTAGAKAIVEKIRHLAPIASETESRSSSQTTSAAGLIRGLADMLQVAASDDGAADTTKLAIRSSQRIADNLLEMFGGSADNSTQH